MFRYVFISKHSLNMIFSYNIINIFVAQLTGSYSDVLVCHYVYVITH